LSHPPGPPDNGSDYANVTKKYGQKTYAIPKSHREDNLTAEKDSTAGIANRTVDRDQPFEFR
jgi:hypothetical protein